MISFYRLLYMKIYKIILIAVVGRLDTCIQLGACKNSQARKSHRRGAEMTGLESIFLMERLKELELLFPLERKRKYLFQKIKCYCTREDSNLICQLLTCEVIILNNIQVGD